MTAYYNFASFQQSRFITWSLLFYSRSILVHRFHSFLNQAVRQPHTWFLKIVFVRTPVCMNVCVCMCVCVRVCVSVCVSAPEAINN